MIETRNSRLNLIFTVWFLLVALIPSCAVGFFGFLLQRNHSVVETTRELGMVARLKADRLNSFVAGQFQFLHLLNQRALVANSFGASLRAQIDAASEGGQKLYVVNAEGRVVYPIGIPDLSFPSLEAISKRQPHVSVGRYIFFLAYPVGTDSWLVELQDIATLSDLAHQDVNDVRFFSRNQLFGFDDHLGTTADLMILDRTGKPLTNSLIQGELDAEAVVHPRIAQWAQQSRDTIFTGEITIANREVLAYARRTMLFDQPVLILTSIEQGEVFGRLFAQLRSFLLAYIFSLIGILLVLYLFVRSITRSVIAPIQRTIIELDRSSHKIRESIDSSERIMHTQQSVADRLFANYKNQVKEIKSVDSEIESIVSSLAEISKQTKETAKNVQRIDTLATQSQNEAQETSSSLSSIKRLATSHDVLLESLIHYSAQVDSIAADVGKIAVATKYLSLNATIEAGKSDDRSRSLSSLVSEVGRLALVSREASIKIDQLVTSIQKELGQSKESSSRVRTEAEGSLVVMGRALERLDTMSRDAMKIATSVRVIDQAVHTQSASTVEIAQHARDLTGQAQATVREANKIGTLVKQQADSVRASASAFKKVAGIIAKLSQLIGSREKHAEEKK